MLLSFGSVRANTPEICSVVFGHRFVESIASCTLLYDQLDLSLRIVI
jgi:hypothetical protein